MTIGVHFLALLCVHLGVFIDETWCFLFGCVKLGSVYLAVFINVTLCSFWLYLLMKHGSAHTLTAI